MSPQNIIAVILVGLIIFFESLLTFKNKGKALLSVPMITWMLHTLLFYFIASSIKDKIFVNGWSQALRIHGYLVILSLSVYRYQKYHIGEY